MFFSVFFPFSVFFLHKTRKGKKDEGGIVKNKSFSGYFLSNTIKFRTMIFQEKRENTTQWPLPHRPLFCLSLPERGSRFFLFSAQLFNKIFWFAINNIPEKSGELGERYDQIVQHVRHGVVRGYQRTLAESIQRVSQHVRIIRLDKK